MTATKTAQLEDELRRLDEHGSAEHAHRRIDLLNDLSWEIALSEPARARASSEACLAESESLDHPRGIAFAKRNLAYLDLMETRLEPAFHRMKSAVESMRALDEKAGLATAVDALCLVCLLLGDYEQARRHAHETLELNQALGDVRGQAWAEHNLGWVHKELKNHEESERHLVASRELFRSVGYDVGLARVLGRLGALYQDLGRFEDARPLHEECLTLARSITIPLVLASAYNDLAMVLRRLGDLPGATRNLMLALDVPDVANRDVRAQTFLELGRIRIAEGRFAEARRELAQALETIADASSRLTEQAVHAALATVHESLGDPANALYHLKRRLEIQEVLFDEENRRSLHNFEIRLKVQQAERETELERTRNAQLAAERERSETLLRNILPDAVAQELKDHGRAEPRHFDSATVLFTDFVGFTSIAERLTPAELIGELDRCFSYFDSLTEQYGLEKLKTIGDAYMAAGGIPEPNGTHAIDCALAAMEIRQFMQQMAEIKAAQGLPYWELRIGMATGPLVAGVVGNKKFAYDVWGDTVNTASRLESAGASGRINVASATARLLEPLFELEYRGKVEVKNKAPLDMYYLVGLRAEFSVGGLGRVPNETFRRAREDLEL